MCWLLVLPTCGGHPPTAKKLPEHLACRINTTKITTITTAITTTATTIASTSTSSLPVSNSLYFLTITTISSTCSKLREEHSYNHLCVLLLKRIHLFHAIGLKWPTESDTIEVRNMPTDVGRHSAGFLSLPKSHMDSALLKAVS